MVGDPRTISCKEAEVFGLGEAFVLSQIRFWSRSSKFKKVIEGETWIYLSLANLHAHLPFLSYSLVRRARDKLVKIGAVKCRTDLSWGLKNRTSWYCISENISDLCFAHGEQIKKHGFAHGEQNLLGGFAHSEQNYYITKETNLTKETPAGSLPPLEQTESGVVPAGEEREKKSMEKKTKTVPKKNLTAKEIAENLKTPAPVQEEARKITPMKMASLWRKKCAIAYDEMSNLAYPTKKELGQWKFLLGKYPEIVSVLPMVVSQWSSYCNYVKATCWDVRSAPTRPHVSFLVRYVEGAFGWAQTKGWKAPVCIEGKNPVQFDTPVPSISKKEVLSNSEILALLQEKL